MNITGIRIKIKKLRTQQKEKCGCNKCEQCKNTKKRIRNWNKKILELKSRGKKK